MTSLLASIFGNGEDERMEREAAKADESIGAGANLNQDNTGTMGADVFEKSAQFQNIAPKIPQRQSQRIIAKQSKASENQQRRLSPDEVDEIERRTIFVGNLPPETNRKKLAALFHDCGKITSTRIRSVPITPVKVAQKGDMNLVRRAAALTGKLDISTKAAVHGYVVFEKEESAEKAVMEKNNMLLPEFHRRIRVDHSKPTWIENAKRAVFVGNLPFDDATGETDLHRHFAEHCGCEEVEIEGVRLVRDKSTYLCKGFGYVLFANPQLKATALRLMPGTIYKERELRVVPCSQKNQNPKQETNNLPTADDHRRRDRHHHETDASTEDRKEKSLVKLSASKADVTGALRRILLKEERMSAQKPRRPRGNTKPEKVHKAATTKKAKNGREVRKLIQKKVDQVKRDRR